jgi:hypothetical protein
VASVIRLVGSVGGESIDFAGVASIEPAAEEILERKLCEGGCDGAFYRVRPATAREGGKLCKACQAKTDGELMIQAGETWRSDGRRSRRPLSDEQKQAARERAAGAREALGRRRRGLLLGEVA